MEIVLAAVLCLWVFSVWYENFGPGYRRRYERARAKNRTIRKGGLTIRVQDRLM
jgi:hypothetical protein